MASGLRDPPWPGNGSAIFGTYDGWVLLTVVGSRPLHVVRVIARLNIGGPARHVAVLDTGLRDRGYVTLLLYGDPEPGEGSLSHLVTDRRLPTCHVANLGRRFRPWGDVKAFFSIVQKLFEIRPDVTHTHTAKAGFLGRVAAILYNATRIQSHRCLVVHTYHGNVFRGYFGQLASMFVRAIERALALGTDQIAVLSEQQRNEIVEELRIAPATKVTVVPLGLDLEPLLRLDASLPTLRRELGLPDDIPVMGFVGRLVPIKDPTTLIRAFSLVKRRVPDAVLLLVGDGPMRGELETQTSALGIANAVKFLGWRQDLPAVYGALDIVLLSSINEGTPVSVIEAMAAGRAVVATDVGGVRDVVESGQTGVLVPPKDPEALAEAVSQLATDAHSRSRMGQAGRQVVQTRFRVARLIENIDRLYREGLATKRRTTPRPTTTHG